MRTVDKDKAIIGTGNYMPNYANPEKWCQYCVYFGQEAGNLYDLCAKNYLEITRVNCCGHCDSFSKDKKINIIKLWLLRQAGFQLVNQVR